MICSSVQNFSYCCHSFVRRSHLQPDQFLPIYSHIFNFKHLIGCGAWVFPLIAFLFIKLKTLSILSNNIQFI